MLVPLLGRDAVGGVGLIRRGWPAGVDPSTSCVCECRMRYVPNITTTDAAGPQGCMQVSDPAPRTLYLPQAPDLPVLLVFRLDNEAGILCSAMH